MFVVDVLRTRAALELAVAGIMELTELAGTKSVDEWHLNQKHR